MRGFLAARRSGECGGWSHCRCEPTDHIFCYDFHGLELRCLWHTVFGLSAAIFDWRKIPITLKTVVRQTGNMNREQRRTRGKILLIAGCAWFILTFFWLPPLMLLLGWFRLPDSFYVLLLRSEFVMSAFMAATGVVFWNSAAKQRISVSVSIAAYSLALLAILATFNLYGFIHLIS